MRFEIYSPESDIDLLMVQSIIKAYNGYNCRKADRDMGTWWGTNQPKAVAFSMSSPDWENNERRFMDITFEYKALTKQRCFIEPRRAR